MAALTKEEGNDEGTAELIAYEIGSLYDELKEFEEKLKADEVEVVIDLKNIQLTTGRSEGAGVMKQLVLAHI
ncbi:hypothetical protein GH714_024065 [Hevea brasiliensis]|uniref:Uncharacterized protein n=1 Tax=Hevea brasiliensis TaxID=3981 RepID=A0A6A6LE31_HEVBR|nr:hypothetical protein GH714_024065 [Hevea brasiliensis]